MDIAILILNIVGCTFAASVLVAIMYIGQWTRDAIDANQKTLEDMQKVLVIVQGHIIVNSSEINSIKQDTAKQIPQGSPS